MSKPWKRAAGRCPLLIPSERPIDQRRQDSIPRCFQSDILLKKSIFKAIARIRVHRSASFILGTAGGLLLLAIVFAGLRAYLSAVPLGPQQQVTTLNPKMGVHTRLTDEAEEWKIKRSLELVREMGVPWIVEYFPWAYYEPRPGHFEWEHPDAVIAHANRQGLTVIARLGFVPDWARPKDTIPLYLGEESYADFGRYAAAFATRYRGEVSHIILWNEPNLSQEWGYRPVDPESYTRLLKIVYPLIKAANPEVQVLAGALAPTLAPPGSEWGLNDLLYLQRMYTAGAGDSFDILAIHVYGWSFDADDPPDAETVNFRRAELIREVMVRNGDGHKQAIITESGWNDHPRWNRAVSPGRRIANTIRAYEIAAGWPWLDSIAMWAFRYPWDAKNYQDHYTFVGSDFEPKPIYLEVQAYSQGRKNGE